MQITASNARVAERQPRRVADDEVDAQRSEPRARPPQLRRVVVEADGEAAAAGRLGDVPPVAAPDVEHARAAPRAAGPGRMLSFADEISAHDGFGR